MADDAGGTLKPGELLNNTYVIEALIGSGGTGEVYRARNRVSGREVAIKILRREFAGNEQFVDLMRREASVLHEVMDDAVVRYHDLLESDAHGGFVFLVMEFIRGESLATRMSRAPVDAPTLLRIARRMARGLAAAHAKLAFHRDLSPDNIILRDGDPDQAIVIDFGIAKDMSADARTVVGAGFAGKYQYAAPEQMDGTVDGRSDLYAMGMTLLAAFRGRTPEVGRTYLEVLKTKSVKPDIGDLPASLGALVSRLVEPDPAGRFQSAAEVAAFLDGTPPIADRTRVLGMRPTTPPTAATPPPATMPVRRRGRMIALIAVLVFLAAGTSAWLLVGRGADPLVAVAPQPLPVAPPTIPAPPPPLPVADPFRMRIARGADGAITADGHAPSVAAAAGLRGALAGLAGTPVGGDIAAAQGMPGPGWMGGIEGIARALVPLTGAWSVDVTGPTATVAGEAPDAAIRDRVLDDLRRAAAAGGLTLTERIALAEPPLAMARLAEVLGPLQTCGPLAVDGAGASGDTTLPTGAPVTLRGSVARADDTPRIEGALRALVGKRALSLELGVVNPTVCRVIALLPPVPAPEIALVFGYGDRQGEAPEGLYRRGENPVIDLILPGAMEGFVNVFYVDGEGQVFHFMPHHASQSHAIEALAQDHPTGQRIRLTYPVAEASVTRLGFRIVEPFGVKLVVAVVTPRPIFEGVRPRSESIDAFLPEYRTAIAAQADEARVAWRYLVTGP